MTNFAQRTAPSTTMRDPWPHPLSLSLSSGLFSRSTSPCLRSRCETFRLRLNALNWKGESNEVHEDHLWRRGLRLWRRRHGGQLQVAEADILNEQNFDNNQQTFLPFISTHPPPPQASLPRWRPCCQSLQLKWSYSTQKSKIRPSLERKVFETFKLQALRHIADLFSEMMYI